MSNFFYVLSNKTPFDAQTALISTEICFPRSSWICKCLLLRELFSGGGLWGRCEPLAGPIVCPAGWDEGKGRQPGWWPPAVGGGGENALCCPAEVMRHSDIRNTMNTYGAVVAGSTRCARRLGWVSGLGFSVNSTQAARANPPTEWLLEVGLESDKELIFKNIQRKYGTKRKQKPVVIHATWPGPRPASD